MMTGPCVSRCESLTALPRASGRAKSGACALSLRACSAAPEFMSCLIGLSKSCSRFVGNQLAPSAINSSICCCNGVFVGTVITMIVLLAIGMGLAACSFTHFIGSKRSRRESFVTERSSLARAVNETPGLLVGCSYNRCLSHFHCLLNRLQLNLDGDHRTRRQLHCRSPAHAKIGAIDLRRSSEACAHAHLSALTTVCDVEGDGPGYPMHGQVPRHLVVLPTGMLNARALKGDRGILLHGKEGGGPQVSITQLIVRIDAGRLHGSRYPGVGRMLLINMEMSTKRVEASSRRADRQDSDSKRHV